MQRVTPLLSRLLVTTLLFQLVFLPSLFTQGCSRSATAATRTVAFDVDEDALEGMTARERLDQMRDWLLLAALSDAKLPASKLIKASSDLPPLRHGYLRPVSNYEYGEVRSRRVGDDDVLALLPADKPSARADYLADVADEHRESVGAKPARLRVASYKLDSDKLSASLGTFETVKGDELFTEKYNYREATVRSPADLEEFLKQTDDITYARMTAGGLVLGGRKLKDYPARRLRVEDVAALWQSEESISARLAALFAPIEAREAEFKDRWQRKYDEFNARWKEVYYSTERERDELTRRHDRELHQLEQLKEQEREQLDQRLALDQKAAGARARKDRVVSGSGFSLDPHYDYEVLGRLMPQITDALLSPRAGTRPGPEVVADIQKARAGLSRRDANPFFALVEKYNQSLAQSDGGKSVLQSIDESSYGYQLARYDGELRGTEVGMVLFYTDLLAKIWAIDYLRNTPIDIADFKPLTKVSVAPIHRQEQERLTSTRVWFGPRGNAFQSVNGGDTLLFTRNATRVFAASHSGVENDLSNEEPPSPAADAFIGWWNDHYGEVARYEPEYLRLNQIMKWSLLIGWLNNAGKGDSLGFLGGDTVKVDHGHWFPDWARQQNLRFKDWGRAGFYERGFKDAEAEAMRLLSSDPYGDPCGRGDGSSKVLIGGVSLANRRVFTERPSLPAENTPLGRMAYRADVDPTSISPDGSSFRTIEGEYVRFGSASDTSAQVTATAGEGARLYTETSTHVPAASYEQTVTTRPGGSAFDLRLGGDEVCNFEVAKDGANLRGTWRARDSLKAESLARRLSRAPETDAGRILALDPDVSEAISLPDGQHLVRIRGSKNWFRFGGQSSQDVASRVSGMTPQSRVISLTEFDAAQAGGELTRGKYVRLRALLGGEVGRLMEVVADEPTSALRPLEVRGGEANLSGQIDPESGDVYFRVSELPRALQDDPVLLGRQVGYGDLMRMRELARTERAVSYARELKSVTPEELSTVDRLAAEYKYEEAASELDKLMTTRGRSPDLTLLKGSLLIRQGRLSEAVGVAREVSEPLQDVRQFYDQLYELHRRGQSTLGRSNLRRYEEFILWNQRLRAQGGKTGETISLVVDGEKLDYEVRGLTIAGEKATPPAPPALRNSTFYIVDDPRLIRQDWSNNFDTSLSQAVSGDFDLYSLSSDEIKDAAPHHLFDPQGKGYTRVKEAGQSSGGNGRPPGVPAGTSADAAGGNNGPRKFRPYLAGPPGGGSGGDASGGGGADKPSGNPGGGSPGDCGEEKERRRVYVVMERHSRQ